MAEQTCKIMTMPERKAKVAELVSLFKTGFNYHKSNQFNEAQTRKEFIDPLLKCLGWDVDNEKGAHPNRREVIVEDRQKVGGTTKHPDYTLRIGGQPIFYVEAKQPSVNLKADPEPALQVRRYAYTAKMPVSILTDFEELAIYDTRIKPSAKDSAGVARIRYYNFEEYEEKFEEIYNLIGFDAVDRGSLDTFVENASSIKGTVSVDDDILKMIESWRNEIAEDIALHNEEIDEFNLTSCVQKIIDRIIFLRICEDKDIEESEQLRKQVSGGREEELGGGGDSIYSRLKSLFSTANEKFNAGLFAPDEYLDSLNIQDKTISKIINQLYYPECQYEFSVLPVEILGSIYERFLGKIIRFTRKTKGGHSITIEEKPEVQKAGGVFYTPDYIVRYIVSQTIGKKIEGKTPEQISKMRFVDPACGSGSFLVGAFQYLLDYHLDYYEDEANIAKSEKAGKIYKDAASHTYKLSVEEKRRILLNNIYGVDIDAQAVEVTKLSLFLKLLENEGKALRGGNADLFRASDIAQEKILPDMRGNIKCGNSLIGSDYYAGRLDFDLAEQRKVNAFDWEFRYQGAGDRFQGRGFRGLGEFDCVIGNPPYLRVQGLRESHADEAKFMETRYKVATGRFDFYVLFLEKGFSLLKDDGILSFILPHKFINSDFGIGTRKFIYENKALKFLVHFGANQVFEKASVYTCIIGLSKNNKSFDFAQVEPLSIEDGVSFEKIPIEKLKDCDRWSFQNSEKGNLIDKLRKQPLITKDVFKGIFQGVVSGDNKAFYLADCRTEGKFIVGKNSILETEIKIEKEICRQILTGKTVNRYAILDKKEFLIYPYHQIDGKTTLYTEKELKDNFPNCYEYLCSIKKRLANRGTASMKYPAWYALWNARNLDNITAKKILTPDICYGTSMTFDDGNFIYNDTVYGLILRDSFDEFYKPYLAILNSPITWFFLQQTGTELRGGYFRFKTKYLEPFPLPDLSVLGNDASSVVTCAGSASSQLSPINSQLSIFVDQMLATKSQLAGILSDSDRKLLEQKCEILDQNINAIVYQLYGLTEEEIAIVEGK